MVRISNIVYGVVFMFTGALIINPTRGVKVFPRENKPAVARLYSFGPDKIMVEDKNGEYLYESFDTYLNSIPDEVERATEKARIEKLVGWND